MKHIAILIPKGEAVMGSIEGPYKVLAQVNDFLAEMGEPPMFDIKLVGLTMETQTYEGLFAVRPHLPSTRLQPPT